MKRKVAVAQMTAQDNKAQNLEHCELIGKKAKAAGVELLCLPENCAFLGRSPKENQAQAEPLNGPTMAFFQSLAQSLGFWLSIGGFQEQSEDKDKFYNTHVLLDPSGKIQAVYRKIHLFSVNLPDGTSYREGDSTLKGKELCLVKTPFAHLGLSICYDLRFAEIYTELAKAGAQVFLVPAAFTATTGKAHWEILLRARAIECQAFVIASAQNGRHHEAYRTHGHAMIVDPWGTILAQCGEEDSLAVAEIDLSYLEKVRKNMPVFEHRNPLAYGTIRVCGS